MKPRRIFLIRHGESQGNVNKELYRTVPDWKLELTDVGIQQASNAGIELAKHIDRREYVAFYVSPWVRTRQTAKHIITALSENTKRSYDWYKEDPRIREQEWGNFQDPAKHDKMLDERDAYGTFYYRIPNGESGADVYDRISSFLDTLWRDFEKNDFPQNCVLVMHGLAIRLFLMRWFHWPVEYFETLRNPHNCEIFKMLRNEFDGKYRLVTEMRIKEPDYVHER